MDIPRRQPHQKNESLEALLSELGELLKPCEEQILDRFTMPKYPVVLLVGSPRCGSTLLLQWLANTDQFAYPSNLVSRFFASPYIGAKIQLLLTGPAYNFNDEFLDLTGQISFASALGKTRGVLAPNEFWYFWRRFIPNIEPRFLSEEEEKEIDGKGLASGLAAFESVFDKPVAMKGHLLESNIPALSRILDKVLFIFIERHPYYLMQSLYKARIEYFGTIEGWYSVKPRDYEELAKLDPFSQIAGQVHSLSRSIEEGLARIESARSLTVHYEQFCEHPETVYRQISEKLSLQGCAIAPDYDGPDNFRNTNKITIPRPDSEKLLEAYGRITGSVLEL